MKSRGVTHFVLMLMVGLVLGAVLPASAQKRGKLEAKFSGSIKIDSIKTPDFKDSKQPPKGHWCRITVAYDIKDTGNSSKFTDNLEIVWKVVVLDKDKKPLFLTQTISYEDVEEGSGHHACVYIRPEFFKRYRGSSRFGTTDFSVYVELRSKGQKLDAQEDLRHSLPHNWYKEAEGNKERNDRYLLPRSKTPFAALDYDYYDNEKTLETVSPAGM